MANVQGAAPIVPNPPPAPAAPAAGALGFAAEPDLLAHGALMARIRAGAYVVPAGYVPRVLTDAQIVDAVPGAIKGFATGSKRLLTGTTFTDVATAYVGAVVAARDTLAPQQLLRDMILSVYVAYTVSRQWTATYATFGERTLFAPFDIQGRAAEAAAKDAWVNSSSMNSTAIHLLGYMIVNAAPNGSFLAKLRTDAGTPFALAAGEAKSEQAKIMKTLSESISAADRDAALRVAEASPKAIRALNAIFGAQDMSLEAAVAMANAFPATLI